MPVLTSQPLLDVQPSPNHARDGVILAASATEGVLLSRDGGRHWTAVTEGLPAATVNGLALSPAFACDGIALALSADTLVRTSDGGATWELVTSVPSDLPIMSAAFSPTFADDGLIALGCHGGVVLTSTDAGNTWAAVDERFSGSAVVDLAFSPRFAENGTLLAGTTGDGIVAVYRSTDRGASWSRYVQLEGAYHWASLAIPDAEPDDEEFFCLATGAAGAPGRAARSLATGMPSIPVGGKRRFARSSPRLISRMTTRYSRPPVPVCCGPPAVAVCGTHPLPSLTALRLSRWLLPAMPRVGKC